MSNDTKTTTQSSTTVKVDTSKTSTLLIFHATWLVVVSATITSLTWSLPDGKRFWFAAAGLVVLILNPIFVTYVGLRHYRKFMGLATKDEVEKVRVAARQDYDKVKEAVVKVGEQLPDAKVPKEVRALMQG